MNRVQDIEAVRSAWDFISDSVSQLDDRIVAFALSDRVRFRLFQGYVDLAPADLALLETFVKKNQATCDWIKSSTGTTAMIQFKRNGMLVNSAMARSSRGI